MADSRMHLRIVFRILRGEQTVTFYKLECAKRDKEPGSLLNLVANLTMNQEKTEKYITKLITFLIQLFKLLAPRVYPF